MSSPRIGVLSDGCGFPTQADGNAAQLCEGFRQAGLEARVYAVRSLRELLEELERAPIELAFMALDAQSPLHDRARALLDVLEVPSIGSDAVSLALSKDRLKARELFRLHNLPVVPHYCLSSFDRPAVQAAQASFGYPVRVLPRRRSVRESALIASNFEELFEAVQAVTARDTSVLVERAVRARRFGVGILEGRTLGALEQTAEGWIVSNLTATRHQGLVNLARRAAEVLDCRGAVSVELWVTEGGNEYVSEVNAEPDLGERGLLRQIAERAGFDLTELCRALVRGAQGPAGATRRAASWLPAAALPEPRLAVWPLKQAV